MIRMKTTVITARDDSITTTSMNPTTTEATTVMKITGTAREFIPAATMMIGKAISTATISAKSGTAIRIGITTHPVQTVTMSAGMADRRAAATINSAAEVNITITTAEAGHPAIHKAIHKTISGTTAAAVAGMKETGAAASHPWTATRCGR